MSDVNTINGYEIADKKARESLSNIPEPWKVLYEGMINQGTSIEIPDLDKYRMFYINGNTTNGVLCVKKPNQHGKYTDGYISGSEMRWSPPDPDYASNFSWLYCNALCLRYENNTIYFGSDNNWGTYGEYFGSITFEINNDTMESDPSLLEAKANFTQPAPITKIVGIM